MFKVEIIVDAKKLSKALMALDGLGYDLQVHFVKGAAMSGGKLVESGDPTSASAEVVEFLRHHFNTVGAAITTREIKAGVNASIPTVSYTLKRLVANKSMKRTQRGAYIINHIL